MTHLKKIKESLQAFANQPLADAAIALFEVLGYKSNKRLKLSPNNHAQFVATFAQGKPLNDKFALSDQWKSIDFLFQLTDDEVIAGSKQPTRFESLGEYNGSVMESYIFLAMELKGEHYTRSALAGITREVNKLFAMPALVLFRYGDTLTLAIINRRLHKRDQSRDVLEKVTLIKDIAIADPHRGHLDILASFSMHELMQRGTISNFVALHAAVAEVFNIELLNKRFYKELAGWYAWATETIRLPIVAYHLKNRANGKDDAAQNTAQFTIRLLCRTLFCWFLKERQLIAPRLLEISGSTDDPLFPDSAAQDSFLSGNHYYRGILQNIFFNCLNTPMGDARRLSAARAANDKTVSDHALRKLNYRGKNYLPADFDYTLFDRIPYLNGGLFDCLAEDNASDTIDDAAISVPNRLFYGDGTTAHPGLNAILSSYKFTITENTPFEQEIALDPELLGLIFENLLAEVDANDPDAQKSAKKASGSYYTPRRIIDYMVNESLRIHLENTLRAQGTSLEEFALLRPLLLHNRWPENATEIPAARKLSERIVTALESLRILDPACGSGAFPMGALHRIVEILHLIDPENTLWKQQQFDAAAKIPSAPIREAAVREIERAFARDNDDYGRKLYLIKNALYGIDIQPLAVLITKLRFFISLLSEQRIDPADVANNYGLIPMPNLETKLLCANTLREVTHDLFAADAIARFKIARDAYYQPDIFHAERDRLADEIAAQLSEVLPRFAEEVTGSRIADAATQKQRNTALLKEWFRHSTLPAPFFLFDVFFPEVVSTANDNSGFDIIIGNPPYGGTKISDDIKNALTLGSKDIYGAFIARFLADGKKASPLRPGGILAYIVSDTFMTIKTHHPLRCQLMGSRLHKAIRVAGDTFNATVNTAIIVAQKGDGPGTKAPDAQQLAAAWQTGPFCQMVDLTNISIHTDYDRFLALLQSTAGENKPRQISTEECASYTYPQALIATNTNLPFFVASPKLFALMNDTTAPISQKQIGGKTVIVLTIELNGKQIKVTKLAEIAEVKQGLATGDNNSYLFQNPDARGNYRDITTYKQFLLTDADLLKIQNDDNLRKDVVENGISKDDKKSNRYFGGRYIVPYDKGGESDADEGWMPNYYVPTNYFIDWSEWAVKRMQTLTIGERDGTLRRQICSAIRNADTYFTKGISFSPTGQYSPTFRLGLCTVYQNTSSGIFSDKINLNIAIGLLSSRLMRYVFKGYFNHTVHTQEGDLTDFIFNWAKCLNATEKLVSKIINNQQSNPRYDYASHEQLEIDRLIYEAYGLNADDIEEVETWYARRYPKLAAAQRENLRRAGKLPPFIEWNIYCDESRHLAHNRAAKMLLGALSVPRERVRPLTKKLRNILHELGLPRNKKDGCLSELKWTKVSPAGLKFYEAALDFFVAEPDLRFHALAADKAPPPIAKLPKPPQMPADGATDTPEWLAYNAQLEATAPAAIDYLHAHEAWYYDCYFDLLRRAIKPAFGKHIIYLDVKDTRGGPRIRALEERLSDAHYDWLRDGDKQTVEAVRQIHSSEVLLDQLADVLLGALSWIIAPPVRAGNLRPSPAKQALAKKVKTLLETAPAKITLHTPQAATQNAAEPEVAQ